MSILNTSCGSIFQSSGPIERLPMEILYHIFDYLDVETIVLSIRCVSRYFMVAANTYDQYDLDFNLISKRSFALICRLIQPENIVALKFADNTQQSGQIDLFLSSVELPYLTRLRSLVLYGIENVYLQTFVDNIPLHAIQSLDITIQRVDRRRISKDIKVLTRIFSQVNIRKLSLNLHQAHWRILTWPSSCSVQELKLYQPITFNCLCQILKSCLQLQKLFLITTLHSIFEGAVITPTVSSLFQRLTSVTLATCDVSMNTLESYLKLMPSLVQLGLRTTFYDQNFLDGSRWERLIERNLSQLKSFEFFFTHRFDGEVNIQDLERLMVPFRSPFWTETKRWFIFSRIKPDDSSIVELFTRTNHQSNLECDSSIQNNYLSNVFDVERSNMSIKDSVKTLKITLNKKSANLFKNLPTSFTKPLYSQVTELQIYAPESDVVIEPENISMLIDYSKVTHITLYWTSFRKYDQTIWKNLSRLILLASHLSSLRISHSSYFSNENIDTNHLLSILSPTLQILHMSVNNLDLWEAIMGKCSNLVWTDILFRRKSVRRQIIAWCEENSSNSSYWVRARRVRIWFGERKVSIPYRMQTRQKRIKLSND